MNSEKVSDLFIRSLTHSSTLDVLRVCIVYQQLVQTMNIGLILSLLRKREKGGEKERGRERGREGGKGGRTLNNVFLRYRGRDESQLGLMVEIPVFIKYSTTPS